MPGGDRSYPTSHRLSLRHEGAGHWKLSNQEAAEGGGQPAAQAWTSFLLPTAQVVRVADPSGFLLVLQSLLSCSDLHWSVESREGRRSRGNLAMVSVLPWGGETQRRHWLELAGSGLLWGNSRVCGPGSTRLRGPQSPPVRSLGAEPAAGTPGVLSGH